VNDTITALSAADGKPLWTCPDPPSGYRSPEDLFVIDDTLWHAPLAYGLDPAVFRGRDMKTGEVRAEFAPDIDLNRSFGHHRCHRGRATSRYVLTSCLGVEFVDLAKQQWHINHWVRGACLYGIMPANGMIYAPQHPCACYQMAKLYGFCALAPATDDKAENRKLRSADQLERGPAYEQIENRESEIENPHDWPTYRHDIRRSGSTPMPVSTALTKKWRTAVGGKLSSVTAAGSRVFLASVDRHMLFALDSEDGSVCWSFTANGRIDSPPSICAGKVVFGSCDGSVYCLRATDGALVWRYRPQTANRKMMFFDQLEATHPVHGSVSVKDGKAYFIAGRTAVLDGGLHFVCLDVHTGREQFNHNLSFPPGGKKWDSFIDWVDMGTLLSDILVGDDTRIYLRTQPLDYSGAVAELLTPAQTRDANTARHLIPATGFLDDDYWHRSYWLYGNWRTQSYIYYQDGLRNPAGRILVVDDSRIFGFGRKRKYYRWTTPIEHELFAMDKNPSPVKAKGGKGGTHLPRRWQQEIPFFAYAMVKADTTVFAAGPPDIVDEERVWRNLGAEEVQACLKKQDEAFRGTAGGHLWAVDAKDGTKIKELILDSPPVWDGMAAACNKLYVTLRDGSVVCFE
jgi:outer membrane protein assembly factor BamB